MSNTNDEPINVLLQSPGGVYEYAQIDYDNSTFIHTGAIIDFSEVKTPAAPDILSYDDKYNAPIWKNKIPFIMAARARVFGKLITGLEDIVNKYSSADNPVKGVLVQDIQVSEGTHGLILRAMAMPYYKKTDSI